MQPTDTQMSLKNVNPGLKYVRDLQEILEAHKSCEYIFPQMNLVKKQNSMYNMIKRGFLYQNFYFLRH